MFGINWLKKFNLESKPISSPSSMQRQTTAWRNISLIQSDRSLEVSSQRKIILGLISKSMFGNYSKMETLTPSSVDSTSSKASSPSLPITSKIMKMTYLPSLSLDFLMNTQRSNSQHLDALKHTSRFLTQKNRANSKLLLLVFIRLFCSSFKRIRMRKVSRLSLKWLKSNPSSSRNHSRN